MVRSVPGTGSTAVDPLRAAAEIYAADACARAHGIVVELVEPGRSVLTMPVREDMLNPLGIVHGGITFLLADTALAYTANAVDGPTVTSAAEVAFTARARLGDVLAAECTRVHQDGRNGVFDVAVRTGAGETVALYRGHTRRVGSSADAPWSPSHESRS